MYPMRPFPGLPMRELRRELDRLFSGFLGGDGGLQPFPALNVSEDTEGVVVEAEVPGLQMADLELTIQGDELTIRGRRKAVDGENTVYHRRERGTGEFARFLKLPVEVDADKVAATLTNGVLTITMPKSARAKARKIAVRTA